MATLAMHKSTLPEADAPNAVTSSSELAGVMMTYSLALAEARRAALNAPGNWLTRRKEAARRRYLETLLCRLDPHILNDIGFDVPE